MGIALRAGRTFDAHDTQRSPYVAVVSESFARRHWPQGTAIGQHFTMTFNDRTVVGVVNDVKVRGLDRSSEPQVYFPPTQVENGRLAGYAPKDLVIRTREPASLVVPAVRRIVHEADAEQPLSDVRSMADIIAGQTTSRTAQLRVLAMLATLAFVLAGVGLHGLLGFAVSQRSQEIGVRMALGAKTGQVMRMVLRRGLLLALAGIVPGLALAYCAGKAIQSVLFGVLPYDPLTFAAVIALAAGMTVAGSFLPARRAATIDPMRVLRNE
jgi:hypothetical protein